MSFTELNSKQKLAVYHNKGPAMVLAGPGSGKTTVIIHRIKYLIEKYNVIDKNILVITFTKSSAEEMKSRFYKLYGLNNSVVFGTFHSCFFKIIRLAYGYNLYDLIKEEEKSDILKKIMYSLKIEFNEEDFKDLINEISIIKNDLINIDEYESDNFVSVGFRSVFKMYEQYKQENNKIDFDDMLVKCYDLLKENYALRKQWVNIFQYIMIDEFQDINKVQYECIKLLVNKEQNIMVVGDDDQSIYKFRGARPEFLQSFSSEFTNVNKIILDINYRSTDQIIKLCNSIISGNKNRFLKIIKGTKKKGHIPILMRPNDISIEAVDIVEKIKEFSTKISLKNIAVIYRTNIQARAIVEALTDCNIPYILKDEMPSIYEHRIAKDIYSYFQLALDINDNKAAERIINKPKRYINKDYIIQAKKNCDENDSIILKLLSTNLLKKWQSEKIDELIHQIKKIRGKSTFDAMLYIRQVVGYDKFIQEYSQYKKINPNGLFEVLDELQEATKNHENIESFLTHVEEITSNINQKRKEQRDNKNIDGVVLSTMHSAKGLEFDVVFIISAVEGIIPYEKSKSNDEIEEERRLFYVAMTRAKKILYISVIKSRYERNVKITRFLNQFNKKI